MFHVPYYVGTEIVVTPRYEMNFIKYRLNLCLATDVRGWQQNRGRQIQYVTDVQIMYFEVPLEVILTHLYDTFIDACVNVSLYRNDVR